MENVLHNASRRTFGKIVSLTSLALVTGMTTSCNIFQEIMSYVPVALTAFTTIVTMINPAEGSVVAGLVTMVKAALADIQSAVTAYENASPANKVTLEGKISTAIAAAESVLQQFWSDLKLPGGSIATLVEGVINVILSTLASFLPSLPAPAIVSMKSTANMIVYTPKKRSLKQFKSDLNAEFVKAGQAPIFN